MNNHPDDSRTLSTSAGFLNSGVIEMRALAARSAPAARESMATMDIVLSVGSVNAPLARPITVPLPHAPKRSNDSAWRAVVVIAATLALALVLHGWRTPVVADVASEPVIAVELDAPEVIALAPATVAGSSPTLVDEVDEVDEGPAAPTVLAPAVRRPSRTTRTPSAP